MTAAIQSTNRAPRPSGLADVLELVLDRGVVIDAYVRLAVVGIEILTLDARIVIASVDTYLRFAEAVNRLDLQPQHQQSLPGLVDELREGGAKSKTKGALSGAAESAKEAVSSKGGSSGGESSGRSSSSDGEEAPRRRRSSAARKQAPRSRRSARSSSEDEG